MFLPAKICAHERSTKMERKIVTDVDYGNRWVAYVDGTFDADWDGETYVSTCPLGIGNTEAEVVEDLKEQLGVDA
jgi:hypothetical protein